MSVRQIFDNYWKLLFVFFTLLACAPVQAQSSKVDTAATQTVLMRTTMGDILIELDAERAPRSVENFLAYVDDNFYANTVFHRVIEGFMIQGGGFTTQYQRKTTRSPVSNEAYNGLLNRRYTIAMARTTAPHSATSQFFINSEDNSNLDHTDTTQRGWGYTVFGRVVGGQDIVDAISQTRTSSGGPFSRDVPVEPVVILGVERIGIPAEANKDEPASGSEAQSGEPAAAKPTTPSVIQNIEQDGTLQSTSSDPDINKASDGVISDTIKQN